MPDSADAFSKEISFRYLGENEAFGNQDSDIEEAGIVFRDAENIPIVNDMDYLKKAEDLYRSARKTLFEIFQNVCNKKDFTIEPLIPYAKAIVESLLMDADAWMHFVYYEEYEDNIASYIAKHSLNTAIIAVRIGVGLDLKTDELQGLALQAFSHDIGMLTVPHEIIKKPEVLSQSEYVPIIRHTETGYDMLMNIDKGYEGTAQVIRQTHERWDGSGYPNGLKNGEISEHSLIIGISDTYDAMLHTRPYRARSLPFEVVKHIITSSKEKFPKGILKALINEFSLFPRGIFVKLNSKETGRVIACNKCAPMRPIIEIVSNVNGEKLKDKKIVDMLNEHTLQIVSAFYEEEK